MKKHAPPRQDPAIASARERARRAAEDRRAGTKQLLNREGYESIDDYLSAAQSRMLARGHGR